MTGTTKDHPPTLLGGTAIKPVERKGWEKIRYFIHNPETGEFFTRTPKSWTLIFIFYCIFYGCLAAFWYGLLMAFFSILPTDHPKWTLDDGLIGSNPGLGMRPVQSDSNIDSSMIKLKYNARGETPSSDFESSSNVDWAKRLQKFLEEYNDTDKTEECEEGKSPSDPSMSCAFDVSTLGSCSEFPYGYELTGSEILVSPCILLKPNRLYNWVPEPYDPEEVDNIEDMPSRIKDLVKANPDKLYIDCQGENPYDREGVVDMFEYFPSNQAIDFKYFPYTQVGGNYHNPVVAVKLRGAELGRLYHIECRLWGKGIVHDSKDRAGLFHFEYIVE